MERLTVKRDKPSINSQYAKKEKVWTADCIEKLGKYEDAEEQGFLLRLPCKVGDTVYHVVSDMICEVENVDLFFLLLSVAEKRFGKTIFLTQEEAEQALKQMGE